MHLVSEEARLKIEGVGEAVVVLVKEPIGADVEVEVAIRGVIPPTAVEPLVPEVGRRRVVDEPIFGR